MVLQSVLLEHLEGSVFEPLVHFLRFGEKINRKAIKINYFSILGCITVNKHIILNRSLKGVIALDYSDYK